MKSYKYIFLFLQFITYGTLFSQNLNDTIIQRGMDSILREKNQSELGLKSVSFFCKIIDFSQKRKYKVIKISELEKAYIITFSNESDSVFYDVVSLKSEANKRHKIKVGRSYKMIIKPYFQGREYLPNHAFVFNVEIEGVSVTVPSNSWTSNVYTTPNLKGVYYVKFSI